MRHCMVPGCDQPAVELHSNDERIDSPLYAERWVCRWHQNNPFPAQSGPDGGER